MTRSTDERAHNDDGALAGLDPGHVGHACSNTRDGGRRARRETCALAQANRRRVVCCATFCVGADIIPRIPGLRLKVKRFACNYDTQH